MTPLDTV